MKRYTQTHDKHLNGNRVVTARGKSEHVNTAASVMTREDAGVDCESPWVASCDKHGEMIGCNTKRDAINSARHSNEWCSGCKTS